MIGTPRNFSLRKDNSNIKRDLVDRVILINDQGRTIRSKSGDYHFLFCSKSGLTCKFGRTGSEDPLFSPWGNEIADIEVTTLCNGIRDQFGIRRPCPFCYKSNESSGKNMSFEVFCKIFDLMSQSGTMTQIAFGVDAECKSNPDLWKMMDYCRKNYVVPNVTVADIDRETAMNIVRRCGACAVSAYPKDKNRCYDSVKLLIEEAKLAENENFQVNIHLLMSKETEAFCHEVIFDIQTHDRLKGVNALVLLTLKKKGRGSSLTRLDTEGKEKLFNRLLDLHEKNRISFGIDSCGANLFLNIVKRRRTGEIMKNYIEPCESLLFSIYINVDGKAYPCSFVEGEQGWEDGIDLLDESIKDFTEDVWNNPRILEWRNFAIEQIKRGGVNSCQRFKP